MTPDGLPLVDDELVAGPGFTTDATGVEVARM